MILHFFVRSKKFINYKKNLIIRFLRFRASGQVFTAKTKSNDDIVAIKCMDFRNQPKKDMLLSEIKIMQQYRHENLVNYIEVIVFG